MTLDLMMGPTILKAFSSRMLKILAFNNSKHYFIYFYTSLFNIPNIKCSIFLALHLNIYIFNSLMLKICIYFSVSLLPSKSKNNNKPILRMFKILVLNNSKHYFIYFNISLFNIPNIKYYIFLALHLNVIIF